jgi:hypothetical protein
VEFTPTVKEKTIFRLKSLIRNGKNTYEKGAVETHTQ